MNENSPEAWLGQFLVALELQTSRGTLEGAKRDPDLLARLSEVRASAGEAQPLVLLDPDHASRLRASDWAAWWRAQEALSRYAYATLALALLGEAGLAPDLAAMYRQAANSRIRRDTHYVLCFVLRREWPQYEVTEGDLGRLGADI